MQLILIKIQTSEKMIFILIYQRIFYKNVVNLSVNFKLI